jgi:hypothetical protein
MRKFVGLLSIIFISTVINAQEVYKIYDGPAPGSENWTDPEMVVPAPWGGNPLIYNVTEPSITVYRPARNITPGAVMIIAPGGGNRFLTWKEEGTNVAEWFQRHGVTGIILKYRTIQAGSREEIEESFRNIAAISTASADGNNEVVFEAPEPVEIEPTLQGDDGRQAMKYVREHAEELGINPDKVGLMGFSAGAVLTSNVMYIHDETTRPDLAAFIYGRGVANTIPDPMPLFLCSPVYDAVSLPATGLLYMHLNWKAAGVPTGLQFIHEARHGNGLQYNGQEWNEWIDNLYNFMKAVNFIEK